MKFSLKERETKIIHHYNDADFKKAEELSSNLKKELGELLKAVIFFGSAARGDAVSGSDVDVMIIINDLKYVFSAEVVESLRVIIETTASKISENFHITTMHLSKFWDYVRLGDPIIVNILRDGVKVYDEGFFEPIQYLLELGQIRPTKEAVWSYYLRAPKTIRSAEKKMLSLIVDLYWAVIDASHALLMHIDLIPPAPHHVADMIDKHYVKTHLLEKKHLDSLRNFYTMAKEIGHEKVLDTSGQKIDKLLILAKDYLKRVKELLQIDPEKLKKATK